VAVRFLPIRRYQVDATLSGGASAVFSTVRAVLASKGCTVSEAQQNASAYPTRSFIIGSGRLNLNPTKVTIEMAAASRLTTTLRIGGAAKEGLFNQRSAEKAVARVLGWLGVDGRGGL
jgi:hypothetical protein